MLSNLVAILVLYCVYYYLKNLNNCKCVSSGAVNNLKTLELILIGLNFAGLLFSVLIMNNLLTFLKSYQKYLPYIAAVYFLGIFIFDSIFLYNSFKFYDTMKSPCACAESIPKYFIYFQGLMSLLVVFSSALFSIYGLYLYATGAKVEFSITDLNRKYNKKNKNKIK